MKDLERRLVAYLRKLSSQDAHALLRFAAFLAGEHNAETNATDPDAEQAQAPVSLEPNYIERPEKEKVVDALKRLSATYPMLEKKKLLDKSSTLVAQHIMFGKPAKETIDEIEKVFADAYAQFVNQQGNP
jgi:hypothetical protein